MSNFKPVNTSNPPSYAENQHWFCALSTFLPSYLHIIYLSFSFSINSTTYLSTYLSIYLPMHLFIYLSIHPSIHLSIYLSTYLSVYNSYLSICLSFCLSVRPSDIYPSVYCCTYNSHLLDPGHLKFWMVLEGCASCFSFL